MRALDRIHEENLASKVQGLPVPIILVSSEAHPPTKKAKVKFPPKIFKGLENPIPKIIFGGKDGSPNKSTSSNTVDLRELFNKKKEISRKPHRHYE